MAELGIIASVVQLAGAAITSARALCDLVDTIKHAPEEVSAISKDTHAFRNVVSSVKTALQDNTVQLILTGDRKLSEVVEGLEEPLKNCSAVLAQLKPRIESHLKPTSDGGSRMSNVNFKWYFKKRDIADCRNRLEATKATLDTALTSVVFLCSLRITGRDPDSSLGQKTLHSRDDVDAGSALLKYAGSIAPHSPPLPGALDQQKRFEDPISQELTPSDSRSSIRPLTPPESAVSTLDRLRRAENQRTGLHNAARDGDDLIVQLMIEEGCDINIKAGDGRTALHFAAQYGHEDVAQTLLSNHADVNAKSKSSIRGTEDERKFEAGRTPLHWAAATGHEGVVRNLLEYQADVSIQNATGRSALQDAIWKNHDRIALLLMDKGSLLMNQDNEAWTPLHEACSQRRLQVVQALILKGITTGTLSAMLEATTSETNRWNSTWHMKATPLFFATIRNHIDCVRYLVQHGASNSKWGDTPLHAACVIGSLEIVRIMLGTGVDIEIRDSLYDETPLLKAASTGKTDVIKYLLSKGADPHARNSHGRDSLEHCKLHQPGKHPQAVAAIKSWIDRQEC